MNAAAQALEKQAAERIERWPDTQSCILELADIKKRLADLGWKFDTHAVPEPGVYEVICSGFPGQYTGQFLSDYMGSGCWQVEDPHKVGAGDVFAYRSKDWHV